MNLRQLHDEIHELDYNAALALVQKVRFNRFTRTVPTEKQVKKPKMSKEQAILQALADRGIRTVEDLQTYIRSRKDATGNAKV